MELTHFPRALLILLIACPSPPPVSDAEWRAVEQLVLGGDCVDPRDYGAVANDGADDMAALQAAIDAAPRPGVVCLPCGKFHVTKRPGTGLANVASLTVSGDGLTIYGQGDCSRISMLGDSPGDWWVTLVTGSNHTLRNFSVDGAERGTTTEQTHLIQVLGPAQSITIESLRLNLPSRGPSTGGDCIRAAGEQAVGSNPATPVEGLVIDRVRGIDCDRSFVGLQRWVFGVRITNSSSNHVGDQVLDEEPTGYGTIGDVVVRDCRFRRNGLGDAVALSIAGGAGGAEPGYDHLVERTTVDGGILVFNSGQVTLRNVRAVAQGTSPTVDIRKDSAHVTIDGGYYEHFGSTAAPVVNVSYHTSTWPRFVAIAGEAHLVQRSGDHVIRAEPAQGLTVSKGVEIECLQPITNLFAAIFARATVAPATGINVDGPVVTGWCKQLVRAAATASYGIGTVRVRDAEATTVQQGVFFENGTPTMRPVVDGNSFGSLAPVNHVVGAGAAGFIGTNQ